MRVASDRVIRLCNWAGEFSFPDDFRLLPTYADSRRLFSRTNEFTVICWCSAVAVFAAVSAQAFEVHGTVRYESYLGGATNWALTKTFKVEVDGCDWLIRTSSLDDCSYVEKGFRQGDLFNLAMYCANSHGRPTNTYAGLIESDELPDDDGSQINYLWLAYASACYFDREFGNTFRPVCCLDDRELRTERFKVQSYLERSEFSPHLPTWVVYLNDGYYRVNSSGRRMAFKAPPPFDLGYTNAIYAVGVLTNCGTSQVPLEFEFTRFAVPRDDSARMGLVVRTRIVGKVTTIAERHSSLVLLPQFPGEFYVKDNRYISRNPPIGQLRYKVRDGEWLEETNIAVAKATEIKQQALQEQALRRRSKSNYLPWIRGVLLGGVLLALVVLYRFTRSTRTEGG